MTCGPLGNSNAISTGPQRRPVLPRTQAVVRIPRWFRHPKTDKDIKRRSKHWAHDEFELCNIGDVVRIEECRALSKRKAHVVAEILRKEDGSEPPAEFPKW